ncbi:hypothetical protein ABTY63_23045 [Streptomyces solisilvae]|uniref:hypothetical protein n=1 Tax=Streptomyces malaysiensis TaxID=92644 RepID=UPI0033288068
MPATSSVSVSVHAQAEPVTPSEVLRRAATWLTANNGSQVPYSQTSVWSDGYRQDCSGYVSNAAATVRITASSPTGWAPAVSTSRTAQ